MASVVTGATGDEQWWSVQAVCTYLTQDNTASVSDSSLDTVCVLRVSLSCSYRPLMHGKYSE